MNNLESNINKAIQDKISDKYIGFYGSLYFSFCHCAENEFTEFCFSQVDENKKEISITEKEVNSSSKFKVYFRDRSSNLNYKQIVSYNTLIKILSCDVEQDRNKALRIIENLKIKQNE
ncbi:MAG: hypothetical protein ACJAWW_002795 [Sulfurimonas sp.]|jgi:hypothetical protein